jgi:hypothetical protein
LVFSPADVSCISAAWTSGDHEQAYHVLSDLLSPACCELAAAARDDRDLPLSIERYHFTICRPGDPGRDLAEDYIRRAFHRVHGANIRTFMPVLLTLHDAAGHLSAVVGYRAASDGKLYLEQYLDHPVEASIAAQARTAVQRHSVVEIGNLACRNSDIARRLMRMLPQHLLGEGYLWVTFTAIRSVRDILQMFNAPLVELGKANAVRVAGTGDDWGRYYNSDPRVIAGYLPDGCASPSDVRPEREN